MRNFNLSVKEIIQIAVFVGGLFGQWYAMKAEQQALAHRIDKLSWQLEARYEYERQQAAKTQELAIQVNTLALQNQRIQLSLAKRGIDIDFDK